MQKRLCVVQSPFGSRKKNIPHPVLMRRQRFSIPSLNAEKGPKPMPIRMIATFKVLTGLNDTLFTPFDAFQHGPLFFCDVRHVSNSGCRLERKVRGSPT